MTRYELQERIGVGAIAETFRGRAVAAGGFEKPVAIKRILPHLGQDRRFVEALIAEAKILSQLRHRNIVQIFDVGLGEDGQHFLVMEYVDGTSLAQVQQALEARRRRLPLDLALHLGAEVCEALDHAHDALGPDGRPMRLVHRDVAPPNVLISRHGEIKLTNFGLARRPEDATRGVRVKGKFGYVSPEGAAGAAIDLRSDVFSAAVMVYELALGRRLFSHLPDLEAVTAVRACAVPRPRDVDPDMPPGLDDVLMAALERDPARRIASASAFGARLRNLRYSLDISVGDPAQELARVVAGLEAAPRTDGPPRRLRLALAGGDDADPVPDAAPASVSLTLIDPFGPDPGAGLAEARAVLVSFEEEVTRLAGGPRETAPTGIFVGAAPVAVDEQDESTRVAAPRRDVRAPEPPPAPRRLAPGPTPAQLPGLARRSAPTRTATPTVPGPPGGEPPRRSSVPPVAGFEPRARGRGWLVAATIAAMLLGLTLAWLALR